MLEALLEFVLTPVLECAVRGLLSIASAVVATPFLLLNAALEPRDFLTRLVEGYRTALAWPWQWE